MSLFSACSQEATNTEIGSMEARAEEWNQICQSEQKKAAQISALQSKLIYPAKDTTGNWGQRDSMRRMEKAIFTKTYQKSLQRLQFDLLQMCNTQLEASAWLRGAKKSQPSNTQLRRHWDAWQRRFFNHYGSEQRSREQLLALLPVKLTP